MRGGPRHTHAAQSAPPSCGRAQTEQRVRPSAGRSKFPAVQTFESSPALLRLAHTLRLVHVRPVTAQPSLRRWRALQRRSCWRARGWRTARCWSCRAAPTCPTAASSTAAATASYAVRRRRPRSPRAAERVGLRMSGLSSVVTPYAPLPSIFHHSISLPLTCGPHAAERDGPRCLAPSGVPAVAARDGPRALPAGHRGSPQAWWTACVHACMLTAACRCGPPAGQAEMLR